MAAISKTFGTGTRPSKPTLQLKYRPNATAPFNFIAITPPRQRPELPEHRDLAEPSAHDAPRHGFECVEHERDEWKRSGSETQVERGRVKFVKTKCSFYSSEMGCKFRKNCKFEHSNPYAVERCRFGVTCKNRPRCRFRHDRVNVGYTHRESDAVGVTLRRLHDMDVKLEKILAACNYGDDEYEARLSAQNIAEIEERKKDL